MPIPITACSRSIPQRDAVRTSAYKKRGAMEPVSSPGLLIVVQSCSRLYLDKLISLRSTNGTLFRRFSKLNVPTDRTEVKGCLGQIFTLLCSLQS